MTEDHGIIAVKQLTKEILKKWLVILLVIALCAGAAYLVTQYMITPVYRTSSTIFVGKEEGAEAELSVADITVGQRLTTDYRVLITSDLVIQDAIQALPVEYRDLNVQRNLSVEILDDSRFMRIAYEDENPEKAMMAVNAISEALKTTAEEIVGVKNLHIVDYARLPDNPVRPVLLLNVLIAGLLGFVFSVLFLIARIMFNSLIRNQEDIESELGLPVLGVIPAFKEEDEKERPLPRLNKLPKLQGVITKATGGTTKIKTITSQQLSKLKNREVNVKDKGDDLNDT